MRRRFLRSPWLHFAVGLGLVLMGLALRDGPPRVATFNVENFRADDTREAALFEEIEGTDASIVAVQEVRDTAVFAEAVSARLGDDWAFVHANAGHEQRVGIVFDRERARLLEPAVTIEATLIGNRAKAALYARFGVEGRERPLRVVVVHLTSGVRRAELRARQLDALRPTLRRAVDSGDEVILLGDFNAVTDADRARLAELAEEFGLPWATQTTACSAYWQRADHCEAETLDHIFADTSEARMHGGCATDGCGPMESCPVYRERVSDHCPVSIELR
jgi:endonuclease/exonuclease/phosphatase family metal-dependent hydrolase